MLVADAHGAHLVCFRLTLGLIFLLLTFELLRD
jgi:hypothetical protein